VAGVIPKIALKALISLSPPMTSILSSIVKGLADTFEEFCQFFCEQKEANPEFLNFYEVICGDTYQKLRFDIDAPMEFIEHLYPKCNFGILPEPVKPEPTGNEVTDCVNEMKYELAIYDTAEQMQFSAKQPQA